VGLFDVSLSAGAGGGGYPAEVEFGILPMKVMTEVMTVRMVPITPIHSPIFLAETLPVFSSRDMPRSSPLPELASSLSLGDVDATAAWDWVVAAALDCSAIAVGAVMAPVVTAVAVATARRALREKSFIGVIPSVWSLSCE